MAVTANKTEIPVGKFSIKWEGLSGSADTGTAVEIPGAADKSVHVFGSFDGGTVTFEGSNEDSPTNWVTLHDSAGDALSFTSDALEVVVENTRWIRVALTGASGSADVNVFVLGKSMAR